MKTNRGEILLVEDNINDAKLTIMALKEGEIKNKIVHVKDGEEALNYIFCQGPDSQRMMTNPILILLDLKMPKVDGIEVLRKIKADEQTKTIPVIVFSSSQENSDVDECYTLGANSYIVKPMEFDKFYKAVTDLGLYWSLLNHTTENRLFCSAK